MTKYECFENQLRASIERDPTGFTWNNDPYVGLLTPISQKKRLELGGFVGLPDAEIYCVKSDFVAFPQVGDTLTVNAIKFRVIEVVDIPEDPGIRFVCQTPNR